MSSTGFATCNGVAIVSGELLIPQNGAWTADLHLANGTEMSGAVAIVIGNLTLQGTVYRSSVYGGQAKARVIAGSGGWRNEIPPQGYGSAGGGVQLSTVVADAAQACGERATVPNDVSVGPGFARFGSGAAIPTAASDVLWGAVARGLIPGWYVDQTGLTQATSWPTTTIGTPFTVTHNDPSTGLVVVATEDYASWMPGCQFTSPLLPAMATSSGVHYVWGDDGVFRFEVYTGDQDAYLGPLQAVIHKELSHARFYGRYRYTISNPTTTTVDASPVNTAIGLPELQSVPLLSDSVSTYTPPNGGTCHIEFLDGDPGQPVCTWTSGPGTMAQILAGTTQVALVGNGTQSFLPPEMPITMAGVIAGSPFTATGTVTVPGPISGTIIEGSNTVSATP